MFVFCIGVKYRYGSLFSNKGRISVLHSIYIIQGTTASHKICETWCKMSMWGTLSQIKNVKMVTTKHGALWSTEPYLRSCTDCRLVQPAMPKSITKTSCWLAFVLLIGLQKIWRVVPYQFHWWKVTLFPLGPPIPIYLLHQKEQTAKNMAARTRSGGIKIHIKFSSFLSLIEMHHSVLFAIAFHSLAREDWLTTLETDGKMQPLGKWFRNICPFSRSFLPTFKRQVSIIPELKIFNLKLPCSWIKLT